LATVTSILDHLLISALHKKYARYDEVDAAVEVRERSKLKQVETFIHQQLASITMLRAASREFPSDAFFPSLAP